MGFAQTSITTTSTAAAQSIDHTSYLDLNLLPTLAQIVRLHTNPYIFDELASPATSAVSSQIQIAFAPINSPAMDFDGLIEHIIVHYRWIFVLFLLPVSFFYDIYFYTRNRIVFYFSSAPKKHLQKVQKIQEQVRERKDKQIDKPMCTARPGNTFILSNFKESKRIFFPSG